MIITVVLSALLLGLVIGFCLYPNDPAPKRLIFVDKDAIDPSLLTDQFLVVAVNCQGKPVAHYVCEM